MAEPDAVITAPALMTGRWIDGVHSGQWLERTGPYVRRVVSKAPLAEPDQINDVLSYAEANRRLVAGLSPASRASVLERASQLALRRRVRTAN